MREFQTQFLELKTNNYSLEELKRRNENEIQTLRQRVEELEKQLSRAQTVNKINPLSFARNIANKVDNKFRDKGVEQLAIDNDNLMRKIESQEQEFRVTNDTLRQEIQSLIAENDKLKEELKSFRGQESHPECDLGVNSDQIHSDITYDNMPSGDQINGQKQLSYAVLAEKERLEIKCNELQELTDSLRKENALIATQVEELQSKCVESDRLQQELNDLNKMIDRQNSLIEEMRSHKIEIEHKFKADCDKLKAEHQSKVEALDQKIRSGQNSNQSLQNTIKELNDKLSELEAVNKENDKLLNELSSYKEELSFCRTQSEETVERLNAEMAEKIEELHQNHCQQVSALREECDEYKTRIADLESETKRLNQRILDDIEERKIHEKKGVLMVKELKRQLHSERKRADKLQEKLQEVLNESTVSISSDMQRKQSLSINGNNGNDSSSVGSWSFMSGKDNGHHRTSSLHSGGSDDRNSNISPAASPIAGDSNGSSGERSVSLLEKENNQLVARITALQQEKWVLEERVNQLELSVTALNDEMANKTAIIQFYSMEGRPDRSHSLHQSDKLTVKRVVDFIKDKGDENMREINRKVQRMLEETLTKNMHLQENLDSLSQEVQRLNTIIDNSKLSISAD